MLLPAQLDVLARLVQLEHDVDSWMQGGFNSVRFPIPNDIDASVEAELQSIREARAPVPRGLHSLRLAFGAETTEYDAFLAAAPVMLIKASVRLASVFKREMIEDSPYFASIRDCLPWSVGVGMTCSAFLLCALTITGNACPVDRFDIPSGT
jgi:hypothetical protein